MAIVGGCNLILSHEFSITLDKGGVLGPDGICRSFDEKGNGYGRGEGFGVVGKCSPISWFRLIRRLPPFQSHVLWAPQNAGT